MHTVLNYFDAAQNGFISASRYHPNNDDSFEIIVEYQAIADFNDKYLLLVDPMLATGQSIIAVFKKLMERSSKGNSYCRCNCCPRRIAHLENTCLTLVIFGCLFG
jgi:uracil phosphoribosyltransferase